MVSAFVQHQGRAHKQDYLARGRQYGLLDPVQLSREWIHAVRAWLTCKEPAAERVMDDLTAELRMRGLEPPFDAVKGDLARRWPAPMQAGQKRAIRQLARSIAKFVRNRSSE